MHLLGTNYAGQLRYDSPLHPVSPVFLIRQVVPRSERDPHFSDGLLSEHGTKRKPSRPPGRHGGSVAELARLTNRAKPNLLRTLGKLEAFGLLEIRTVDRRRVPTVMVDTLRIEIDPYAMADRIETRPTHG